MAAWRWAFVDAAFTENRCIAVTVTRATRSFLAINLLRRIARFTAGFHFMCACLRIVALPAHHAVKNIRTWFQTEHIIAKLKASGAAAVEIDHIKFHASSPSAAAGASCTGASVERSAAGIGASP